MGCSSVKKKKKEKLVSNKKKKILTLKALRKLLFFSCRSLLVKDFYHNKTRSHFQEFSFILT